MPLPFAPPPKDSKVYQDLGNKKVTDITSENLHSLKAATFMSGVDGSEDEYRRILLAGLVADKLSISGPMREVEVIQITQTSDVGFYDMFKPTEGVWKFVAGDLLASGGSAQINFQLYNGTEYVYIGNTAVSGQEPLTFDNLYKLPDLFITPELWIGGDATSIGTSTRVTMAFIRMR